MAEGVYYKNRTGEGGPGGKGEPVGSWGTLLYKFTQNTTVHGIRYIFEHSGWFIRRFLWILATLASLLGFIYLNYINVAMYVSYPKKVNVEVSIRNNLTFPSVTICNYNVHRFSKVVEMGLFDTFYAEYSPEAQESINSDAYWYKEELCAANKKGVANFSCPPENDPAQCMKSAPVYKDISSTACERLCSIVHEHRCNGFWYQRSKRTCYIWEPIVKDPPPPENDATDDPGLQDRPNNDDILTKDGNLTSDDSWENASIPVLMTKHNFSVENDTGQNNESESSFVDAVKPPHNLPNQDSVYNNLDYSHPMHPGDENDEDNPPCDFEYFERIRSLDSRDIDCKFENDECPFLSREPWYERNEEYFEIQEPFIITEARNPPTDFSTQSARGRYLYLFETDKRQGFHAVAATKLSNWNSKCLEFFYTFVGEGVTELHVAFIGKDNIPINSTILSGNKDSPKWQRFYIELPNGPQRLELRAHRPKGILSSGVAIDNILLKGCFTFQENCLRDRDGRSYLGLQAKTQNGIPCYNSTCRNMNYEIKPWCYTSSDKSEYDYCNIDHCDCSFSEFRCEDSKICKPKTFQCDGKRDCDDYTDEYEICDKQRSIDCNFKSAFACGYQVGPLYTDLDFLVVSSINNTDELGPKTDHTGSRIGTFLNVDARGGREGDRVSYWSPVFNHFSNKHCLKFWIRAIGDKASNFNSLRIHLVDADFIFGSHVHLKTFELSQRSLQDWEEKTVYIPLIDGPQYYRFIWEYTMGFPFRSSLAIDDISIFPCSEAVPDYVNTNSFDAQTSFHCDTFSPECSMNHRSSTAHANWKWVPKQFLNNITSGELEQGDCGLIRVTPEGHFETPLYLDPLLEEGRFCLVHIMMLPGSSITLTFPSISGSGKIQITTEPSVNNTMELQDAESYSGKTLLLGGVGEIKIHFEHDGFGNAASFRGLYYVTRQDTQDYVLAAEYTGSFYDVHHTVDVFSDIMLFSEPHCLSFISYAKARSVQMFLAGRKRLELNTVASARPKPWFPSLYNINLPPGKYNILFSLTLHMADPGLYAVLEGMTVKRGRCQDIGTLGNVTCEFSTIDQCGYLDISSSTARWSRDVVDWPTVPPRSDGDAPAMVLRHDQNSRSDVLADLLTPRFDVVDHGCLTFTFSAVNTTAISISLIGSIEQLNDLPSVYIGDVHTNNSDVKKASIPVSREHHYALFSVRRENSNFIMIDDVHLEENTCNIPAPEISSRKARSVGTVVKPAEAPKFEENSMFSRLSKEFSADRQAPKSYGHFFRGDISTRMRDIGTPLRPIFASMFHRHDMSDFYSADEVFEKTGPELHTFIHSCKFNAHECNMWKVKMIPTDFGMCYTFNPDGDMYTVTPGTRNGLQLILNTEAYETTKSDMTEAGVKVHVHDKDEIPYVRYIGTAAALSTHTYLAITLVESVSLGEPYGSCASSDLAMFPNEKYSKFKCNRQCMTEEMVRECQCRDHYMPGNATICKLKEHLKCKINLEKLECECPNACHVTAFATESSFSSLSKHGVSALLKDRNQYEYNFHKALNYQYRMLPKQAEKVISDLSRFLKSMDELMVFLKRETNFGQTSVTYLVDAAFHEMDRLAAQDIQQTLSFLPDLVAAFSCPEKFLKSREVELAVTQSKGHRFYDLVNKLASTDGNLIAYDTPLLLSSAKDLKDTMQRLAVPFDYYPKCFDGETVDEEYVPLNLFANRSTEHTCKMSVTGVLEKLRSSPLEALIPNARETITEYWKRVRFGVLDMQNVDNLLKLHQNCSNSYSGLLHEINEWEASLSSDNRRSSFGEDFIYEKEILMAREIYDWFRENLFNGFRSNVTTILQLASGITSERFHQFFGEINRIKKKLDDKYLTTLNQEVNQAAPARIKVLYKRALRYMADLQSYVSKSLNLKQRGRNMKLWLKPKVNLDGSKLIEYIYDKNEIWQAWPRPLNVKNFYTFQSDRVLQLYVGDFFRELSAKLDTFEITYHTLFGKAFGVFESLNKTMSEIQQSAVIDEQFILNNFLKLDVYYGELTHELIEQTPAYSLSNFWSDLGGYLGLLLGASVLTICELLDVIFYNAARKCHDRHKRRSNRMYNCMFRVKDEPNFL